MESLRILDGLVEESDVEAAIRLIDWQIAENAQALRTFTSDAIDQRLKHRDGLAREALDQTKRVVTCTEYRRRHGVSKEEAEAVLDELVKAKFWAGRFPTPAQTGGRIAASRAQPGLKGARSKVAAPGRRIHRLNRALRSNSVR